MTYDTRLKLEAIGTAFVVACSLTSLFGLLVYILSPRASDWYPIQRNFDMFGRCTGATWVSKSTGMSVYQPADSNDRCLPPEKSASPCRECPELKCREEEPISCADVDIYHAGKEIYTVARKVQYPAGHGRLDCHWVEEQ